MRALLPHGLLTPALPKSICPRELRRMTAVTQLPIKQHRQILMPSILTPVNWAKTLVALTAAMDANKPVCISPCDKYLLKQRTNTKAKLYYLSLTQRPPLPLSVARATGMSHHSTALLVYISGSRSRLERAKNSSAKVPIA